MQWHRLLGAVCRHSTVAYFYIDPRIRINAEHETRSNARGLTGGSLSPTTSFALAAGNTNPQGIADPPVGSVRPTEEPPGRSPGRGRGAGWVRPLRSSMVAGGAHTALYDAAMNELSHPLAHDRIDVIVAGRRQSVAAASRGADRSQPT